MTKPVKQQIAVLRSLTRDYKTGVELIRLLSEELHRSADTLVLAEETARLLMTIEDAVESLALASQLCLDMAGKQS